MGAISATGPILLAVPGGTGGEPHLALDGVRQDERLAFEVDLEGPKERLTDTTVEFEIEGIAGGSTLLKSPGIVSPGPREGTALAQGVSTVRGLPPGDYVIHAKISNGLDPAGDVTRRFSVIEGHRPSSPLGTSGTVSVKDSAVLHTNVSRMPVLTVDPFALDQVLAPKILGPFIERVAARPDSSDPEVRSLLERVKTSGVSGLSVPETITDEAAGAFLKGLTQLSSMKLEPAATSFRDAIKIAPDFYAAMVYLGACYAAGGKDKDAAAVWRTALIREGDAPELHAMLADAYLRQGRGDLAVADLDEARERWPQDMALKRRFAVAALMGGQTADGLQAVDELLENKIQDEPSLAVAILTIYEAFESGTPIETPDRDRARMLRLADAYKISSGPSQALVDAWVAAVTVKD
jgi:Flp pilus assembly protein TadD